MSAASPATKATTADPKTFTFQQVMLRVRDPKPAVEFFEKLGLRVIDVKKFPEWTFDLYFMASLPDDAVVPTPGTPEANKYLWTFPGCTLELTHNYGTETKPATEKVYWTGNEEPHIGFHSVGLLVDDVDAAKAAVSAAPSGAAAATDASAAAAAAAVASVVPAKADGIVYEPSTGYWVTLHKRPAATAAPLGKLSWLHNAKLRVRNIAATLKFYETHFGATHLATVPLEGDAAAGASIYYVGWLPVGTPVPADPTSPAALEYLLTKRESTAVLGFLHTPGTEKDADFKGFHTGNVDPGRGFGHIGFLTEELEATCAALEAAGVGFKKRPQDGKMRGLAFAVDPDGYWIEIIQRGLSL